MRRFAVALCAFPVLIWSTNQQTHAFSVVAFGHYAKENARSVLGQIKRFMIDYDSRIRSFRTELNRLSKANPRRPAVEQQLETARFCKFLKENSRTVATCRECQRANPNAGWVCQDVQQETANGEEEMMERISRDLHINLLKILERDIAHGATRGDQTLCLANNPIERIIGELSSAISKDPKEPQILLNRLYKAATSRENPYTLLGLPNGSSIEKVLLAYQSTKSNKPNKLSTAYSTLANPYTKAQTDALLDILRYNIEENFLQRMNRIRSMAPMCKIL